jgi:hypothetical protein
METALNQPMLWVETLLDQWETALGVTICSDNQVALKALQAAKTTSPFLRQCQKVQNDISTWQTVGVYWVPGHGGI